MGYCFSFEDEISHKSSPFPTSSSVKFSNLASFSIVDCNLNGTFPKQIFQVPTLKTFDISYNELLDGSFPEFPPDSDLQSLVLYSTNFRGSLPASIGNLGQLSRLDLGNFHFSGPLPKSFSKLTQLVYLDLSSNSFTGPLPSFHLFKNLTDLRLSHNGFTGPIPLAHWESFLNLVNVDLKNNSLNGNISSSMFAIT
ncbi:receptor-like protein 53 [Ziziphus jujuba]|uniref:Receptor-like protein 53 n=1 Tax=Ziziphus jujuba TaxID=326968 RepID=A0ABM4AC46_ZIZJJ|nr:receptor-like protein 53 [Ziziphus jujuba]